MIMTAFFAVQTIEVVAQSRREVRQNQRDIQQEIDRLTREGWRPTAGSLSIREQITRSRTMINEIAEDDTPKYIWGSASGTPGETLDAARLQASQVARIDLVQNIQTIILGEIETVIGNSQLTAEEGRSVTETVGGFGSRVDVAIGRTVTVESMYRALPDGQRMVRMSIFWDRQQAVEAAKNAIRTDLRNRGMDILDRLNLDELR